MERTVEIGETKKIRILEGVENSEKRRSGSSFTGGRLNETRIFGVVLVYSADLVL